VSLARLLAPQTIAVIGGGAWCASIIGAARAIGFEGTILPVHPTKAEVASLRAVRSVADINGPIDAAFIGVNRFATLDVVKELRALGAGGAICFASGFSEASAEDADGADLQDQLVEAAGGMPVLGPNCYGFLNALDRTGIWPDQHGMRPLDRGVAILTQSSNIAINLTMQTRALPLAQLIACGNQAQTTQAQLALHVLDDPRISAVGLHIEGFGDLRDWEAVAAHAQMLGKPLIALKSGKSAQAQQAAISHTASMTGSDAAADAVLARLGIARLDTLPAFLEALKMAHLFGPLPGTRLASISCSGGEAALVADMADGRAISFPALTDAQRRRLGDALGPMVALANPLDYHTYIWRDEAAMTRAWAAMADPGIDMTLIVLDYPRADMCDPSDWGIATRAAIAAAQETGHRYAVVATLPELLPEATARQLLEEGVLPIAGLDEALAAVEALGSVTPPAATPLLLGRPARNSRTLSEAEAKAALAACGVGVPKAVSCSSREEACRAQAHIDAPVALKVLGLAHKSGSKGLALGLQSAAEILAADLAKGDLLVEEMIEGAVAELLVGITLDQAQGFLMTLGAGGIMTELWDDTTHLTVPATRDEICDALRKLRSFPLLEGYRGQPAAALHAVLDAILAIQSYVITHAASVQEVEVNPLLCTPTRAVAVDALIRKAQDD